MFRSTLRRLSIIPDSDDSWETESEDGDAMPDLNDVDSTTEDESADTTGKKREIGNTSDLYPWFQPLVRLHSCYCKDTVTHIGARPMELRLYSTRPMNCFSLSCLTSFRLSLSSLPEVI